MDEHKVISLKSRRPLIEDQQAAAEQEEAQRKALSELAAASKEETLRVLDDFRRQIEEDRWGGLLILSQDMESKRFAHEMIFCHDTVPRDQWFAWAGVASALCQELVQTATMTPTLESNGTIIDPWLDQEEGEEEYDEV